MVKLWFWGLREKSEVGAILIVLLWGRCKGLWTQRARTDPGKKAMKGRERNALSQCLSCHLQKTALPVQATYIIMSWKLYYWHPGLFVLKV